MDPRVCLEGWQILDLLQSLIDKSLIVYEPSTSRYRLTETVREYGCKRLVDSGDVGTLRRQHLGYFLAFADEAEAGLLGKDEAAWLARLEAEHENLRAALREAEQASDADETCWLVGTLARFWTVRGHLSEGRSWLTRALAAGRDENRTASRAKALLWAGWLSVSQQDLDVAAALTQDGLDILREIGDEKGVARALVVLGQVAHRQGDYAEMQRCYEESLTLYQGLGLSRSMAIALGNVGLAAINLGDYARARIPMAEALALQRRMGLASSVCLTLGNLAELSLVEGDHTAARECAEEALAAAIAIDYKHIVIFSLTNLAAAARGLGDLAAARAHLGEALATLQGQEGVEHRAMCLPDALREGAYQACSEGEWERAARLYGAEAAVREAFGAIIDPGPRREYERLVLETRERLGEAGFETVWATGHALELEAAVEYARVEHP